MPDRLFKPDLPRPPARKPRRGPMPSLFWRIFLWFWLGMLLLAVAVTAIVYFADPDQFFPPWRSVPITQMDQLAKESIAAYEQGGGDALRVYLAHLPPVMPGEKDVPASSVEQAFLYDADSYKELGGQKSPKDIQHLVARTRDKGDVQLQRLLTQLLFARSYTGASQGHRYVFMVAMPRPNLLLPTRYHGWAPVSAALATSALLCYGLTRYLVNPVRRLQTAARRLAQGDLSVRVADKPSFGHRRDEFGELAADFDDMAMRIQDLLTAQRRLIGDISHELGSPLTRVNVALGLAFRKAGKEAYPELERIQREAQRLNEMIRQLLMISELENGTPSEPSEPVDLLAVVRDVAADAEFEAGSRRCRVTVKDATPHPDGEPYTVRGVEHLLRSAVENVVRNAIRYTAEASEVHIEVKTRQGATPDDTRALIQVRDHGPGVPDTTLQDLFLPFYRVSEARDRQTGGTGLGLAITRQAVDLHRGMVKATNHPDGGLLVEIELRP